MPIFSCIARAAYQCYSEYTLENDDDIMSLFGQLDDDNNFGQLGLWAPSSGVRDVLNRLISFRFSGS
jgi:hypothetical protein